MNCNKNWLIVANLQHHVCGSATLLRAAQRDRSSVGLACPCSWVRSPVAQAALGGTRHLELMPLCKRERAALTCSAQNNQNICASNSSCSSSSAPISGRQHSSPAASQGASCCWMCSGHLLWAAWLLCWVCGAQEWPDRRCPLSHRSPLL